MTDAEKTAKFDEIQKWLWEAAVAGNPLQSTMAAALIRHLAIPGPDGQDPEDA